MLIYREVSEHPLIIIGASQPNNLLRTRIHLRLALLSQALLQKIGTVGTGRTGADPYAAAPV